MKWIFSLTLSFAFLCPAASHADGHFKKVITVIFENTDYAKTMKQPFFASLAANGALLGNFSAEAHPSQPNYIALTSGSLQKVKGDGNVNLNVESIADLIEAKGLHWKMYAEDYPGHCFQGATLGKYARKHVPFISYVNVQNNSKRCALIQDESAFDADVAAGTLPEYSFYAPNLDDDGHDTGVVFADQWFSGKFGALVQDPKFMKDTLLIITFDENSGASGNQIYTVLFGDSVKAGFKSPGNYNHMSLLRLVEDEFSLGNLGQEDATATPIDDVWK